MVSRAPRLQAPVCQLCEFISARPGASYRALNLRRRSIPFSTTKSISTTKNRILSNQPVIQTTVSKGHLPLPSRASLLHSTAGLPSKNKIDDEVQLARIAQQGLLSTTDNIPTETDVLTVLSCLKAIADDVVDPTPVDAIDMDGSPASALLFINESLPPKKAPKAPQVSPEMQKYVDELSRMAYEVIEFPTVFITPQVLRQYVQIQGKLKNPSYIPSVLELYANKPQPLEGSNPVRYVTPNPNKSTSAVPTEVADLALAAAIDAKNFDAATAIVETSYAKLAFRISKILRKTLVPAAAVVAAPVAAYAVASKLSIYETAADPQLAINMTFIGIMAYMGFTSIIGLVALTTANDQMDRVTWAIGTPLRNRWLREEERAAIDKIAGAWGFRESWRRGEEEGPEWDTLRDWIGLRGMVLDQVSLMEGME